MIAENIPYFLDAEWVGAIEAGLKKKKRFRFYYVAIWAILPIAVPIIGIFLIGFHVLVATVEQLGDFSVCYLCCIHPFVTILGYLYLLRYPWKKLSVQWRGNHVAFPLTLIKGTSLRGAVPCTDSGYLIITSAGLLFSPSPSYFNYNWTTFPIEEIVTIGVRYRKKLFHKEMQLNIHMQNGNTMHWNNSIPTNGKILLAYLRKNKYPLVEQSQV